MIRLAACLAVAGAAACAGPSAPVPTGFGGPCASGPSISGTSEMGVTDRGLHTDVDATISMAGRLGGSGSCFGAAYEPEER